MITKKTSPMEASMVHSGRIIITLNTLVFALKKVFSKPNQTKKRQNVHRYADISIAVKRFGTMGIIIKNGFDGLWHWTTYFKHGQMCNQTLATRELVRALIV